jgi:uncharacterized protein YjbI with pentapeptide repeats
MVDEFSQRSLAGARFHNVDLAGATFERVSLTGARFDDADFSGVKIRGALLRDVDIGGELAGMRVNGMPWDHMPDTPGIPRDRDARPSLEQVLALRADRMATVRRYVADLTDEQLARSTEPVPGPGWPPPESFRIKEILGIVLSEEWWHRQFAERDVDALQGAE